MTHNKHVATGIHNEKVNISAAPTLPCALQIFGESCGLQSKNMALFKTRTSRVSIQSDVLRYFLNHVYFQSGKVAISKKNSTDKNL